MASTDTQQLTPIQRRAIGALADTACNIAEAAQRVGIEEKELMAWLCRDLAFTTVLNDVAEGRRDEAFQELMQGYQWEWKEN